MARIGKRLVLTGLSFSILIIIMWYANPMLLLEYFTRSDWGYIALAFIISSFTVLLRVMKWKVLLRGIGFIELFPVQVLGMTISNLTPGKLGEPVKALILKMRSRVDVSMSMPTIIWERVADIAVLIVLSFFAIGLISIESRIYFLSFFSILLFALLIVLMLVILYSERIGMKFLSFFRRLPVIKHIDRGFIKSFYKTRTEKRGLLACFLITFIAWALEGLTMYLCFLAIGVETQPLLLSGIIALAVLIGVASSLPGGIGSTDAVMVILLGLSGTDGTIAVAGMLLYRFITLWYCVFLGGLSFLYLSRKIEINKLRSYF